MRKQVLDGVLRELGSTASLYELLNSLIERLAKKRGLDLLPSEQIRILRWAQDRPLTNCELLKKTGWLPHTLRRIPVHCSQESYFANAQGKRTRGDVRLR